MVITTACVISVAYITYMCMCASMNVDHEEGPKAEASSHVIFHYVPWVKIHDI